MATGGDAHDTRHLAGDLRSRGPAVELLPTVKAAAAESTDRALPRLGGIESVEMVEEPVSGSQAVSLTAEWADVQRRKRPLQSPEGLYPFSEMLHWPVLWSILHVCFLVQSDTLVRCTMDRKFADIVFLVPCGSVCRRRRDNPRL